MTRLCHHGMWQRDANIEGNWVKNNWSLYYFSLTNPCESTIILKV